MKAIEELKSRLVEENNLINSLASTLHAQGAAQAWFKAKLQHKRTERELFEAFQEQQEQLAEDLSTGVLQPDSQAVTASTEAAKKIIDNVAKINAKDDLGADVIPLDDLPDTDAIISVPADELSDDNNNDDDPDDLLEEERLKQNLGTQESFSLNITLNEDQLAAKEMAYAGKSFALIGAAGTGKTTGQRSIAEALLLDNRLSSSTFKTYDANGERRYVSAPSIAFCAFTRRATANLAKAILKSPVLAEQLENNIMTIHSLLEFEPETYIDYSEGKAVEKFRFFPKRTATNPLTITHLIVEESSMLDAMTLWGFLYNALPEGVQIIFIGDINQLPPVFGPSILNYALVQLPIIELRKVYRNQGIVLENAHRILKGETLLENNNFEIIRGKQPTQVGQTKLAHTLAALFNKWFDMKGDDGLPVYDPEDCMILSPWNRDKRFKLGDDCGTDSLNAWIAQHMGARRKTVVYEIIAGFNKVYLAKGDRVMVNKMDGIIDDIYRNPNYHGKEPQIAGSDLTRFGVRLIGEHGKDSLDDLNLNDLDYSTFSLEALEKEKAERKMQASHTVKVILDNGKVEELSAAGDFGPQNFSLGYALTVHKAQGSEWRKVFIVLHKDHAVSLYRELFYTAVTRARTKVTIVAKDFVIEKAIKNQRIKGDTIEDKIEYFNSGIMDNNREPIYATK